MLNLFSLFTFLWFDEKLIFIHFECLHSLLTFFFDF